MRKSSTVRYSDEDIKNAVAQNISMAAVMRQLGMRVTGGSHGALTRRVKSMQLDTSHFLGRSWNKGKKFPKCTPKNTLIKYPDDHRRIPGERLTKLLLLLGHEYNCNNDKCPVRSGKWLEENLTLDVDHIDGDFTNCIESNLQFLCPNCHRQTNTYGNRIRGLVDKTEKSGGLGPPSRDNDLDAGSTPVKPTCGCGKTISRDAKKCWSCEIANRKGRNKGNTKIVWPSDTELVQMIAATNRNNVSKQLGVTETAVRNHMKRHSIAMPSI